MTASGDRELLDFPCDHQFKVFAEKQAEERLRQDVLAAVGGSVTVGRDSLRQRESSGGRYICLTVLVRVHNMSQIEAIYASLRQVEGVCYLL